jgi:putative membrane protein
LLAGPHTYSNQGKIMDTRTAIINALALGSLVLSGAVLGQPAPSTAAPMQQHAGSQLAASDKDFLEDAAHAGHTEIQGSEMAQTKAKSPDVRAFAATMVQDHTKAGHELNTLAKSKGYTPPDDPSLMQKAQLKALSIMDDSFDKKYVNQIGVSAHEDAVKLFKKAAAEAKDPDVKAFAAKTLPTLEHHLEMARALKQKVDPGK